MADNRSNSLNSINSLRLCEEEVVVNNNAITSHQIHIAICFNQLIAEITKEEISNFVRRQLICVLLNFSLELLNEHTSLILLAAKMHLNSNEEMAEDLMVVVKEVAKIFCQNHIIRISVKIQKSIRNLIQNLKNSYTFKNILMASSLLLLKFLLLLVTTISLMKTKLKN